MIATNAASNELNMNSFWSCDTSRDEGYDSVIDCHAVNSQVESLKEVKLMEEGESVNTLLINKYYII